MNEPVPSNWPRTRSKPPSVLACIACRKSHLKCDGRKPLCRRCAEKKSECIWIESRRGYRNTVSSCRKSTTSASTPPPTNSGSPRNHRDSPTETFFFATDGSHDGIAGAPPGAFVLDPNLAAAQPFTYDELFSSSFTDHPSLDQGDDGARYRNVDDENDIDVDIDAVVDIDISGPDISAMSGLQTPSLPITISNIPSPGGSTTAGSSTTVSMPHDMHLTQFDSTHDGYPTSRQDETPNLIGAYYKYFHPAHPFVIPQKLYQQYRAEHRQILPKHLLAAMRYLGAHYLHLPKQNLLALQKAAVSAIFSDNDKNPDDVYKIQALMIYTCTCAARYEQQAGGAALDLAIQIALKIGLNKHAFALTHAPNDVIVQESLRRTWWSLFLIEGIVTAIGGQCSPFRLYSVFCDVPLPGDDTAYAHLRSSSLTPPRSLADFRNRTFAEDPHPYSSGAYAVEAVFIMGAIFSLGTDTFAITDAEVEAIDSSISNFLLSLPPDKREVVPSTCDGGSGLTDETLLAAHIIINWASILIHRPRSSLTFIRNHYSTICTRPEASPGLPAPAYASHTSKTLRAANSLIALGALQRPLEYCTPIMMCAITVAATVHLPAYAIADNKTHAMAIKERLQLAITLLARFAEIWPRAAIAKSQIAAFAREVLTTPDVLIDATGLSMMPSAEPIVVGGGVGANGGLLTGETDAADDESVWSIEGLTRSGSGVLLHHQQQ